MIGSLLCSLLNLKIWFRLSISLEIVDDETFLSIYQNKASANNLSNESPLAFREETTDNNVDSLYNMLKQLPPEELEELLLKMKEKK